MGQIFIEQGEYGQAVQVLREAAQRRADRPNVFALLGEAYAGDDQLEQAALAWQQAIGLSPENAFYHVQLGDVLLLTGDGSGAAAAYRRALDLNPDNAYVRRQLIRLGAEP
jgi:cytochrome c-type biogenesis protein CcmH/NrfG